SVYLKNARMPMLWVTGTNDFAYPMDSLQKSYRLPQSERALALRVRMPHGHGGLGENSKEIHVFAESILDGGKALPEITEQGRDGNDTWVKFTSPVPVKSAELNYTKDIGKWQTRKWETIPAKITGDSARATVPDGATVFYINVIDERETVASSEHIEVN